MPHTAAAGAFALASATRLCPTLTSRARDANGAGIWVSPGSNENENEIVGNIFENIVLEGDRNIVQAP